MKLKMKNIKLSGFILAFTIFPFVFLMTFTYIPLANMIGYSFTDWDGVSVVKQYVGLKNYIQILTNAEYFGVFKVTFYYLIAAVIQLMLGLFFAVQLNKKLRFKNVFKGVYFFPYLINGVAVAMIFNFFFMPSGTLDSMLNFLGLGKLTQKWLGNPSLINVSLCFVQIWKYLGFTIVIFLGAMQAIDSTVYEAAAVDGAGDFQVFKSIILPSIKNILGLQIILAVKNSLSVFEIPYIMTDGANGSMTFVIKTIKTAFSYNKIGLASAMSIVLFMIIIIITIVQKLLIREED